MANNSSTQREKEQESTERQRRIEKEKEIKEKSKKEQKEEKKEKQEVEEEEEIEFVSRKKPSREKIREIIIVLDKSGSMMSMFDSVVKGYQHFLDQIEKSKKLSYITLVLFDKNVDEVFTRKSVDEARDFKYLPEDGTALYSAIGWTIESVSETQGSLSDVNKASEVLFAIITDGEENSSKNIDKDELREMITIKREVEGWKFVFLGATPEVCRQGEDLGILASDNYDFGSDERDAGESIFGYLEGLLMLDAPTEEKDNSVKKEQTTPRRR